MFLIDIRKFWKRDSLFLSGNEISRIIEDYSYSKDRNENRSEKQANFPIRK